MNTPPIFPAVDVPAVRALLKSPGTGLRFWAWGQLPNMEKRVYPYAVWQLAYGSPENNLSERPDIDSFGVQVDVYAETADAARAVINAIEYAIELNCHIVARRQESRDPETQKYTVGFDCDWWVSR